MVRWENLYAFVACIALVAFCAPNMRRDLIAEGQGKAHILLLVLQRKGRGVLPFLTVSIAFRHDA